MLTFLLGCAVGAVIGLVYYHFHKPAELTKDEEKAIEDAANAVVMLCAYNITPEVIKYYNEDYPYLVVAEKPSSTEVEYWWAGDKEANDLVHSRVADKYKQLGHYVIANAVKGEVHHG